MPSRVTATQKARLRQAMQDFVEMIAKLPDDRSCYTCDFLREGSHCIQWNDAIPAQHLEAGCDRRQEDGAPF